MKIADVMTEKVLTVGVKTPLKEVAAVLAEHRISGLPVVDRGRVVGVVSEGDILAKESAPAETRTRFGRKRATDAQVKFHAHTAGTAMTSPAVTIGLDRTVTEAARVMVERGVNRLPVLDGDGRLVGILTRADLVQAFLRADAEIERELREDVALRTLWIDPRQIEITVHRGEVLLQGEVESDADAELLERFARRVPGVVGVLSRLHWQVENAKLPDSDPRVPHAPRR